MLKKAGSLLVPLGDDDFEWDVPSEAKAAARDKKRTIRKRPSSASRKGQSAGLGAPE